MDGLTCHLVTAVFIAAMGSAFQHGYNVGAVNTPAHLLRAWIAERHLANYGRPLSGDKLSVLSSVASSIFNLGGLVGGMFACAILRGLEVRKVLVYNNILVFFGAGFEIVSKYWQYYEVMMAGRMLLGVCAGLNSGICVIYLCDLAPVRVRGAMGSMYQVCLAGSSLFAAICGMDYVLGTRDRWHFIISLPFIPAVIHFILLFFLPDSPKRLYIVKRDHERTVKTLKWLRGSQVNIDIELSKMKSEVESFDKLPKVTINDFRRDSALWKPLVICSCVMAAQQFSGFAALSFSSHQIITRQAGLGHTVMKYANIGYHVINVVFTSLSMSILVEKAGRRISLLVSFGCMTLAHVSLMSCLLLCHHAMWISYLTIGCVYLYIMSYALGAGPIPWFLVSEMFSANSKPIAQAIVACIHWTTNFIVALCFAPLVHSIGHYVYVIFITTCFSAFVFVLLYVPFTKNRTVEEVQEMMRVRTIYSSASTRSVRSRNTERSQRES